MSLRLAASRYAVVLSAPPCHHAILNARKAVFRLWRSSHKIRKPNESQCTAKEASVISHIGKRPLIVRRDSDLRSKKGVGVERWFQGRFGRRGYGAPRRRSARRKNRLHFHNPTSAASRSRSACVGFIPSPATERVCHPLGPSLQVKS